MTDAKRLAHLRKTVQRLLAETAPEYLEPMILQMLGTAIGLSMEKGQAIKWQVYLDHNLDLPEDPGQSPDKDLLN